MPDSDDNEDDTEREKYGIVGGKETVEKVRETTDSDDEDENE